MKFLIQKQGQNKNKIHSPQFGPDVNHMQPTIYIQLLTSQRRRRRIHTAVTIMIIIINIKNLQIGAQSNQKICLKCKQIRVFFEVLAHFSNNEVIAVIKFCMHPEFCHSTECATLYVMRTLLQQIVFQPIVSLVWRRLISIYFI